MNSPATLEMITRVRLNDKTPRVGAWLRSIGRFAAPAKTESRIRSISQSSGTASSYRLGDAVRHNGFGSGRVMAHWPDGTLLIRFDRETKNRLVWPSLLDRINGR
jgi:hypothetical protein